MGKKTSSSEPEFDESKPFARVSSAEPTSPEFDESKPFSTLKKKDQSFTPFSSLSPMPSEGGQKDLESKTKEPDGFWSSLYKSAKNVLLNNIPDNAFGGAMKSMIADANKPAVPGYDKGDPTVNAFRRGSNLADQAELIGPDGKASPEDLKRVAELQRESDNLPASKSYDKFNNASTIGESLKSFTEDPVGILTQLTVESLTSLVKYGGPRILDKATKGAVMGGTAGSVIPGIGTAAGLGGGLSAGAVVGSAEASYGLEYTGKILDVLKEEGVDLTSEESLKKAFSDDELISRARSLAQKKAIPIALFDLVSGGIAGRVTKAPAKSLIGKFGAGAAELAVQAGLGGGGEAAGELASGEKIQPSAILGEMLGEGASTPVSVAMGAKLHADEQMSKASAPEQSTEVKKHVLDYIDRIEADNKSVEETLVQANKVVNSSLPYIKGVSKIALNGIIDKAKQTGALTSDGTLVQFTDPQAAKDAIEFVKSHLYSLPKYHPLVRALGEQLVNKVDTSKPTISDLPPAKVVGDIEPVLVATSTDSEGNKIETHNTGLKDAATGQEMRVEAITDPDGSKTFQSEDGSIQGPSVEAVARQMQISSIPEATPQQIKEANALIQAEGATKPTLVKIYTQVFGYPQAVAKDFAEAGHRQITKMVKDSEDLTPEGAFKKLQDQPSEADEHWKEIVGEKEVKNETDTAKPGPTDNMGDGGAKESVPAVTAVNEETPKETKSKGEPKVTIKQFEKPEMENPVYVVNIDGKDRFVQRSEGMNPGDTAWYEVVKNDSGSWVDANETQKNKGVSGYTSIGYTKQEAVDHLVNKYKDAVQEREAESLGSHATGNEATGGTTESGGVGSEQQSAEAANTDNSPDRTSPKVETKETVEPSQESMDILDLLSGDIFPATVKDFIEALQEFDEYSGSLGQHKAVSRLNQMIREGLVSIDGNKLTPTFEKVGDTYAPQSMETIVKSNSKKKNPNSIVGGNGIFVEFKIAPIINKIKDFRIKYLRKIGYLPQEVFDLWMKSQGEIKGYQADVRYMVEQLRSAVKEEYKMGITEDEIVDLNRALKNEAVLGPPIPPKTLARLKDMRDMIKSMSNLFISRGLVSGPLAAKFQADMEVYVTRSFRKHDDPAWKDEVSTPVYNKAHAFILSKYPNLSPQEQEGLIDYLLYSPDAPMNVIKGGSLSSIDLSALRKRGKIAPEILALMGEYNDPVINFAKTIQKQAEILVKAQLQADIKAHGLGTYLFDVPTTVNGVEYKVQINPSDKNAIPSPIGPLYTTPEIAEAVNEFNHGRKSYISTVPILGWFVKASAKVNFGVTVLNPTSHSRNFLANPFIAVSNGHFRISKVKAMAIFFQSVSQANDAAKQALLRRYIKHNLINSGVSLGSLKGYIDEVKNGVDLYTGINATPKAIKTGNKFVDAFYTVDRLGTVVWKKMVKLGNNAIDGAALMYQWGDNAWKIYGFENEVANLKEAHPTWTDEQIDEEAAKKTLDIYPTYSHIPRVIQEIKNVPALGEFISFKAEVVRTFHNTIQMGFKEMAEGTKTGNGKLTAIGAARIFGTALSLSAFKIAAETALGFVGGDGQDEDDLNLFVAPYQKTNQVIILGRSGDELTYIDVGPFDPHSYLLQIIRAGFRGESLVEGGWAALKEMYQPFLNQQILYQKWDDIVRNQKFNGSGHIYNEYESGYDQMIDQLDYLKKGLQPGMVKTISNMGSAIRGAEDNYGNQYKISNEILAIFPGARAQTINFTQALRFKEIAWKKKLGETNNDLRKVLIKKTTTLEERARAQRIHDEVISKLRKEVEETRAAAIRQGMKP